MNISKLIVFSQPHWCPFSGPSVGPKCKHNTVLDKVCHLLANLCIKLNHFSTSYSDIYPRIFHERGFERTTSRFNSPPGVGQNVAWALTKNVNFTRIIDDLWYRDINKLRPGRIDDFQVKISTLSMVLLGTTLNSKNSMFLKIWGFWILEF